MSRPATDVVLNGHRIRYLNDASHALLAAAPAVSAHLQFLKLSGEERDPAAFAVRGNDQACAACGNLLIPGWSCQTVKTKHSPTGKHRAVRKGNDNVRKVQCHRCRTASTFHSKKPPKRAAKPTVRGNAAPAKPPIQPMSKPEPSPVSAPADATSSEPPKPGASSTNSRRARGKKSSLQALLANQRPAATPNTGSGLDLMDFMKT